MVTCAMTSSQKCQGQELDRGIEGKSSEVKATRNLGSRLSRAPVSMSVVQPSPLHQAPSSSNHVEQCSSKEIAHGLAQARNREKEVSTPNVIWKCTGSQFVETKSEPRRPDVVVVYTADTCSRVAVLGVARWPWLRAHQVR
jgi:hypothetical protein